MRGGNFAAGSPTSRESDDVSGEQFSTQNLRAGDEPIVNHLAKLLIVSGISNPVA